MDTQKTTHRMLLKRLAGATMATALPMAGQDQPAENPPHRSPARSGDVILEDSELRVVFDRESGALTGLEYKPSNWAIHRRPELGLSFRMQAPLPARHDNFILGQKQRAAKVEKLGNKVDLEWKDHWRIRVGEWRVVDVIDDVAKLISITRIAHQREVYER